MTATQAAPPAASPIDPHLAGRLDFRHRLPSQPPLPPGRHDLGLFP